MYKINTYKSYIKNITYIIHKINRYKKNKNIRNLNSRNKKADWLRPSGLKE